MPGKTTKIISLLLCFLLIFQQSGFAQAAGSLDISAHLLSLNNRLTPTPDKFRPLHLRYLDFNATDNNFRLLLDKGDAKKMQDSFIQDSTKKLMQYFFVGLALPNESFWVNLRPDTPENIIDPFLSQTDVGKILLEADLQLKKDTARMTSPETPEGKLYWEKLYKKAGELLGYDNVTIPTLTRPWIVPGEIIIRETPANAYIYKATLKVMLEQDYLKDSPSYKFDDPRLKTLNEYASQLVRELIIPKLTREINVSKRYAALRQVYYSLILAQWFKQRFRSQNNQYGRLLDRKDLNGLVSKDPWSKTTYFNAYKDSFQNGEYNLKEPASTPFGQSVRTYMSGGIQLNIGNNIGASSPLEPGKSVTKGEVTVIGGSSSPLRTGFGSTAKFISILFAAGSLTILAPQATPAQTTALRGAEGIERTLSQNQTELRDVIKERYPFKTLTKSIEVLRANLALPGIKEDERQEIQKNINQLETLRQQLLESPSEIDFVRRFANPYSNEQRLVLEELGKYVPCDETNVLFISSQSPFWSNVMGSILGAGQGVAFSFLDASGNPKATICVNADANKLDQVLLLLHEGNHLKRKVPMFGTLQQKTPLYKMLNEGLTHLMTGQTVFELLVNNEQDMNSASQSFRESLRQQFRQQFKIAKDNDKSPFDDKELEKVKDYWFGGLSYGTYAQVIDRLGKSVGLSVLTEIFEERDAERLAQVMGERLPIMQKYADLIYDTDILRTFGLGITELSGPESQAEYRKDSPLFKELLEAAGSNKYSQDRFKAVVGVYGLLVKHLAPIAEKYYAEQDIYKQFELSKIGNKLQLTIPGWIDKYLNNRSAIEEGIESAIVGFVDEVYKTPQTAPSPQGEMSTRPILEQVFNDEESLREMSLFRESESGDVKKLQVVEDTTLYNEIGALAAFVPDTTTDVFGGILVLTPPSALTNPEDKSSLASTVYHELVHADQKYQQYKYYLKGNPDNLPEWKMKFYDADLTGLATKNKIHIGAELEAHYKQAVFEKKHDGNINKSTLAGFFTYYLRIQKTDAFKKYQEVRELVSEEYNQIVKLSGYTLNSFLEEMKQGNQDKPPAQQGQKKQEGTKEPGVSSPLTVDRPALRQVDLKDWKAWQEANGSQSKIYSSEDGNSILKIFTLTGVRDEHIRQLHSIIIDLQEALMKKYKGQVRLAMPELVEIAGGGLGLVTPFVLGTSLQKVIDIMAPGEVFKENAKENEAHRLQQEAFGFLDFVDEQTKGLADRRTNGPFSEEESFDNFIVPSEVLGPEGVRSEYYGRAPIVNIDPIDMGRLMERMAEQAVRDKLTQPIVQDIAQLQLLFTDTIADWHIFARVEQGLLSDYGRIPADSKIILFAMGQALLEKEVIRFDLKGGRIPEVTISIQHNNTFKWEEKLTVSLSGLSLRERASLALVKKDKLPGVLLGHILNGVLAQGRSASQGYDTTLQPAFSSASSPLNVDLVSTRQGIGSLMQALSAAKNKSDLKAAERLGQDILQRIQGNSDSIANFIDEIDRQVLTNPALSANAKNIAASLHHRAIEEGIIHVNKLTVNRGVVVANGQEWDSVNEEGKAVSPGYIRVGPVILLGEEIVIPEAINSRATQELVIRGHGLIGYGYRYLLPAIAAVLQQDYSGEAIVEDDGAGTGILSLIALWRGAKRVICIENDGNAAATSKALLERFGYKGRMLGANEWREYRPADSDRFVIIRDDLKNWYAESQGLKVKVSGGLSDIRLANIGPHYEAIQKPLLVDVLKTQPRQVVLGGYIDGGDEQLKTMGTSSINTVRLLRGRGWNASVAARAEGNRIFTTVMTLRPSGSSPVEYITIPEGETDMPALQSTAKLLLGHIEPIFAKLRSELDKAKPDYLVVEETSKQLLNAVRQDTMPNPALARTLTQGGELKDTDMANMLSSIIIGSQTARLYPEEQAEIRENINHAILKLENIIQRLFRPEEFSFARLPSGEAYAVLPATASSPLSIEAIAKKNPQEITEEDKSVILDEARKLQFYAKDIEAKNIKEEKDKQGLAIYAMAISLLRQYSVSALSEMKLFSGDYTDVDLRNLGHELGHIPSAFDVIQELFSDIDALAPLMQEFPRYRQGREMWIAILGWDKLFYLNQSSVRKIFDGIIQYIQETTEARRKIEDYLQRHPEETDPSLIEAYFEGLQLDAESALNIENLNELKAEIDAPGRKENIDINGSIKRVAEAYKKSLKSRIDFQVDLEGNSAYVFGNSLQLRYVWQNLIGNAVHWMNEFYPAGGEQKGIMRISSKIIRKDGRDFAEIVFENTGSEIPQELFEGRALFKGNSRRKGGTGTGLILCDRVVKDHNGTINADPAFAGGARFVILLPLAQGADYKTALPLGSSPAQGLKQDKGGIDFRALPIANQATLSSNTAPLAGVSKATAGTAVMSNINADKEWREIQRMLDAGIIPSADRIKEYLETCCASGDFSQQVDKVLSSVADILRLEEEQALPTEEALKKILAAMESGSSASQLKLALTSVVVLAAEPKLIAR